MRSDGDPTWFSEDVLAVRRKKRPVLPAPPPPFRRGDGVELAIELERSLALVPGAAVVRSRVLWHRVGEAWTKVADYDLARLLMTMADRGTATGPLRMTPRLVAEAVGLLKQRWPAVPKLPPLAEAPHG